MSSSPKQSQKITPPPVPTLPVSPFAIRLASGKQFGLFYGTNTVGRCTPDLVDPAFISIDNENVALSRLHATITIAPNHDAWLRDLGSTNGTHLSIKEGDGVSLEAQCFYQLSDGATITLGDLPVYFVGCDATAPDTASSSSLNKNSGLDIPSLSDNGAPRPNLSGFMGASEGTKAHLDAKTPKQAQPAKATGPYLDDESETSIPQPPVTAPAKAPSKRLVKQPSFMDDEDTTPAKPASPEPPKALKGKASKKEPVGKKEAAQKRETRDAETASTKEEAPATKKLRAEKPKTSAQGPPTLPEFRSRLPAYVWPSTQKLVVCLSGMDTTDRERVSNRVMLLGGTIVEEVSDRTTLLIVKDSPATRTPKFLVALAKGVMIATGRLFTDQHCLGNMSRVLEFVPELSHNGAIVSAPEVVDVILFQQQMKSLGIAAHGALTNTMFTITDVPQKVRGTVGDVIVGSGGKIVKTKRDEAKALAAGMKHITLGADDGDRLYDAIVFGTTSRFEGAKQ